MRLLREQWNQSWDYLGQTGDWKIARGRAGDSVHQRWVNDVGDGYERDVIGQNNSTVEPDPVGAIEVGEYPKP